MLKEAKEYFAQMNKHLKAAINAAPDIGIKKYDLVEVTWVFECVQKAIATKISVNSYPAEVICRIDFVSIDADENYEPSHDIIFELTDDLKWKVRSDVGPESIRPLAVNFAGRIEMIEAEREALEKVMKDYGAYPHYNQSVEEIALRRYLTDNA